MQSLCTITFTKCHTLPLILSVFCGFFVAGLMLQPQFQDTCEETHCKVGGVIGSKANIQNQGFSFTMVSPGIQPVFFSLVLLGIS